MYKSGGFFITAEKSATIKKPLPYMTLAQAGALSGWIGASQKVKSEKDLAHLRADYKHVAISPARR